MKKLILFALLSIALPVNLALSADNGHPIMRPDAETILKWRAQDNSLPKAHIDPAIKPRRGSFSLLPHLTYIPDEREQGYCGNCWVWTGTGCMEVWLNYAHGIADRLSVQYMNSCKTDNFTCCGGSFTDFVDWYAAQGFAVPWSNSGAAYADGSISPQCNPNPPNPAVSCSSIATSPHYPITSISSSQITTQGVGTTTAINNIKNVLAQGKAVCWSFLLPTTADRTNYQDFWNYSAESVLWSMGSCFGHYADAGLSAHTELIVGYNDDDPSNQYWIVVNSHGTASGNRPNCINHLKMDIDYDGTFYYWNGSTWQSWPVQGFYTVDVTFGAVIPIPTPTATPMPTATPPIDLTANKTTFGTTDSISVAANVWPLTVPCYPFVRIQMADGSTLYYQSGIGFTASPTPYLGFEAGTITTSVSIMGYPTLSANFSGIATGTYVLSGGAVDMTRTTSASNLVYFGTVDRDTLTVQY